MRGRVDGRRVATGAGALTALLVALASLSGVAEAAPVSPDAPAWPDAPVAAVPPEAGVVMPGIDARLLGLPLLPARGPDPSAALAAAQTRRDALMQERERLDARAAALDTRRGELAVEDRAAAARLTKARADLALLAAAAYRGGATQRLEALLPARDFLDLGRREKLAGDVAARLQAAVRAATAARRRASAAVKELTGESADIESRRSTVAAALPGVERDIAARTLQAKTDLPARLVAGPGIPVAALDAYLRAQRLLAAFAPHCGIEWWLLAGVARGESGHGTHAGARADADGTVFPAIVGIPLDGTRGTQPVADHDLGLLDADPKWDRAVGPFQFIPGTWRRWASDGNVDGRADPQNLYDAALAAARKLCGDAGPGGLHDDASISRALKPYAVEDRLVRAKLAQAREYQRGGLPAPVVPTP